MGMFNTVLRKHKIPFAITSAVFIGLPEYIDALWSLYERIAGMGGAGLNIAWLYVISTPVGLGMLGYIIYLSTRVSGEESEKKWGHYNKLVDLIIRMETAPHEEWSAIVAAMQRELNAIGDKTINKHMRLRRHYQALQS